jgi:hypothetical protein
MRASDMTPRPQYVRALERANQIRLARAELKRRIASDELDVADVILECPPEANSMAIGDLLMSQRRWGQTRTRKFLAQMPMAEKKTVGSMTERQRQTLAQMLPSIAFVSSFGPFGAGHGQRRGPTAVGRNAPQGASAGVAVAVAQEDDSADEDIAALLTELHRVGGSCDELADELKAETRRRDALIAAVSAAGASRRTVADAAHITVGRVQQIVSQQATPPADRRDRDPAPPAELEHHDAPSAYALAKFGEDRG